MKVFDVDEKTSRFPQQKQVFGGEGGGQPKNIKYESLFSRTSFLKLYIK